MKHSRTACTALIAACVAGLAGVSAPLGALATPPGYADDTRGDVVVDSQGECVKTQRWSKDFPCREAKPVAKAELPPPEKITLSGAVLFDFNKATLRPEGQRELAKAVDSIKEKLSAYAVGQRQITVTGHTDSVGSDAYNQKLSERRAVAVADFMVDRGVDARIIRARGAGEGEPIASNATDEGRQQNRRVEIVYQAQVQPKG